jgi:hypothetical protein
VVNRVTGAGFLAPRQVAGGWWKTTGHGCESAAGVVSCGLQCPAAYPAGKQMSAKPLRPKKMAHPSTNS